MSNAQLLVSVLRINKLILNNNTLRSTKMKKKLILINVFFLLSMAGWAQNIFKAAQLNDITGIKFLLNYGIDVNDRDAQGNTPLIVAANSGQKVAVNFLLEKDADVNAQNKAGNTALISACFKGSQAETDLLIEHHANPNIQNVNGVTALIAAVKLGNTEIVKQLLGNGADARLSDRRHKSAVDYAKDLKQSDILDLLNSSFIANVHES